MCCFKMPEIDLWRICENMDRIKKGSTRAGARWNVGGAHRNVPRGCSVLETGDEDGAVEHRRLLTVWRTRGGSRVARTRSARPEEDAHPNF